MSDPALYDGEAMDAALEAVRRTRKWAKSVPAETWDRLADATGTEFPGAALTRAFSLLVKAKRGEVLQQPVCPSCGSDEIVFAARATYDPRTGSYILLGPDDSVDCAGCGVSGVHPHWRPMRTLTARLERAESLLAELASLLAAATRSGAATPTIPPATVKALAEHWRAHDVVGAVCKQDLEAMVDALLDEGDRQAIDTHDAA